MIIAVCKLERDEKLTNEFGWSCCFCLVLYRIWQSYDTNSNMEEMHKRGAENYRNSMTNRHLSIPASLSASLYIMSEPVIWSF